MDREKVIKALEWCEENGCIGCPYYTNETDTNGCNINQDILELLKEQEPKPLDYIDNPYTGLSVAHCPSCGKFVEMFYNGFEEGETRYCPWCGQAVKWQ